MFIKCFEKKKKIKICPLIHLKKKMIALLTISLPPIECNGIESSRPPRDLRIICNAAGPLLFRVPRGAASARRKLPLNEIVSYVVGSERGPAFANLYSTKLISSIKFLEKKFNRQSSHLKLNLHQLTSL